jgi:hypothetical protein
LQLQLKEFNMPGMMMMKKDKPAAMPMAYKKGGMVFKPCAKCPSPAKCKAAGQCAMKAKAK